MIKAQIDKLGERLRSGPVTEADLRQLDEYRLSFGPSYQEVTWVLRERPPQMKPTGRFPKTTRSIIDKLKRESIRLTQIQDIAGCRIVVPRLEDQVLSEAVLEIMFHEANPRTIDRRERPSHGYRAVHVIVSIRDRPVEIQLRTALQDLWAQLSEKLSDKFGPAIKYGGGSDEVRKLLTMSSQRIAEIESSEQWLYNLDTDLEYRPGLAQHMEPMNGNVEDIRRQIEIRRADLMSKLRSTISLLQRGKVKWSSQ